ncbi:hypothetical protein DFS34DRAFT_374537 [Phlyctochytrium arcticum]|nr:hypothetical protein DFS34DRAFT_374537 [Phlyctochytrium arcticum]
MWRSRAPTWTHTKHLRMRKKNVLFLDSKMTTDTESRMATADPTTTTESSKKTIVQFFIPSTDGEDKDVENQDLQIDRDVLEARSPVLKDMFDVLGKDKEADESKRKEMIRLSAPPGINHTMMRILIGLLLPGDDKVDAWNSIFKTKNLIAHLNHVNGGSECGEDCVIGQLPLIKYVIGLWEMDESLWAEIEQARRDCVPLLQKVHRRFWNETEKKEGICWRTQFMVQRCRTCRTSLMSPPVPGLRNCRKMSRRQRYCIECQRRYFRQKDFVDALVQTSRPPKKEKPAAAAFQERSAEDVEAYVVDMLANMELTGDFFGI